MEADGPRVIRHLSDEVAQLESIIQRLSQLSFASIGTFDESELKGLVRKCSDDLASFESNLRLLDVSGADGRRGRLWRKLKLCFTEKDLDQIRHVVRGHVQLLTFRLGIVQVQQGSFTAVQSEKIFGLLQQLQQNVAALQAAQIPSQNVSEDPGVNTTDQMDLDDPTTPPSLDSGLDDSIARLMRLLEKKPCVIESDDSQELVEDLERLLQSVQKDSGLPKTCACQVNSEDVSKEVKLITNIILSAPSIQINQSGG
ncbi:hypothetical protein ACHAPU_001043 [Fusarium lateritium]